MVSIRSLALSLLSLAVIATPTVWAQAYSGSLTGLVTDPSGAVVPGASIKLTDANKGVTFTSESDSDGRYLYRSLPPGTYSLSAKAAGFKASVREGIVMNVDEKTNLNISLEVGQTQETVDVVGEAPHLSTQDAALGQTLDRNFVNDLPLLGRNVLDLARLSTGVNRAPGSGYGTEADSNVVINGSRNGNADVLIDGVSANIIDAHGGVQATVEAPDVDAVQEFKIQSNFSADVAGYSGNSVINMVMRSGTNSFHGNAYEFLRNDKLAANDWFNNYYGNTRPILRKNQFGGTIGGPIRRNKTFFFFDHETVIEKDPGSQTVGVPSAAMRKGDFGEICAPGFDAAGMCGDPKGQLWDPYSGVYDAGKGGAVRSTYIPFNNLTTYTSPGSPTLNGTIYQIPGGMGNLIDPVASKMMQFYPLPNINVGATNYNRFANFYKSYSTPITRPKGGIKIDHYFSEKDRIAGRFSERKQHSTAANVYGNALDPFSEGLQQWNAYSATLNYTHVFNAKTLLNISMGYITNPVKSGNGVLANSFPKFDISKDLGFPEYMKRSGILGVPFIGVNGNYANGYDSLGSLAWGWFWQTPETHDLNVSLSRLYGRHDLKFGWEGRMHRVSFLQPTDPLGNFNFSQNGSSQAPNLGGDNMASFLMGIGIGGGGSYEMPVRPASQSFSHAGFIQDNWRASNKLTVNVGVRYDLSLPRTERFNHMNYFDPGAASPLQVPGLPSLHGGLVFASASNRNTTGTVYSNFSPRFGFAYSIKENFVVRGGYGIFYEVPRNGAAATNAAGFQGFSQTTQWFPNYQNDGATPGARLSDPFPPNGPDLPIYNTQGLLSFVGQSVQAPFNGINTIPYEQSWNFGIQRQVFGNIILDASYVGNKGTHLYYGGAENFNHLPEIAGSSPAQIAALNQQVANPFYGILQNTSLSGPTVSAYQLQLPFPQFTGVSIDALPVASSVYHSFQFRADKRLAKGLQFLVSYTFSKSIDDASVQGLTTYYGGSSSLQDPNRRDLERGLSQFDATHTLNLSYVYELPFGHKRLIGSNWNPILNGIVGGWKTNGIWQMSSGQPLSLGLANGQSLPTYGGQRPNMLGQLKKASGSGGSIVNQYFANPEVVVAPAPFTLGNASRTLPNLRDPGIDIANISLFKDFSMSALREGMRIEFRVEAFNAFNHPHFCAPDTTLNDGSFGQTFRTCTAGREVQLALKFYF